MSSNDLSYFYETMQRETGKGIRTQDATQQRLNPLTHKQQVFQKRDHAIGIDVDVTKFVAQV
jgi:hypothetical protein